MDLLVTSGESALTQAISKVPVLQNESGESSAQTTTNQQPTGTPTSEFVRTHRRTPSNVDIYEGPQSGSRGIRDSEAPPAPGFVPSPFMARTGSSVTVGGNGGGSQNNVNTSNKDDDYVAEKADGFWNMSWFQRILLFTLLRLFTFVRKLFEDYDATKAYQMSNQILSFTLALTMLFMPTIVYTIYSIGRYFQTVVFPSEDSESQQQSIALSEAAQQAAHVPVPDLPDTADRATSSPEGDWPRSGSAMELESGLVTARQSPLTMAEARTPSPTTGGSEQQRMIPPTPSPAPTVPLGNVNSGPPGGATTSSLNKSSEQINAAGNAVDLVRSREVNFLLGSMTHMVHGMLYIFWQLKRQVDLIAFLCERCCVWRKPKPIEQSRYDELARHSDGLEFFEDFYAGFLGVLVQLGLIVGTLGVKSSMPQLTGATQNLLANTDATLGAPSSSSSSSSSSSGSDVAGISISKTARTLTSALESSASSQGGGGHDLLLMSELIVSLMVIASLLAAVRRRDDGIMTFTLSFIGWGSIFASRLLILSITATLIKFWLIIPLLLHVAGITYWIYTFALASHNNDPNERLDMWRSSESDENDATVIATSTKTTDRWSSARHGTIVAQIVALFAIPSIFYWPIMFNCKLHHRLFKYLALIMAENLIMILMSLFGSWANYSDQHRMLTGLVAVFSITGFAFLACYVMCKPSLTEHFARHDQLANEAQSSGIYYEFCQRVFKLPDVVHDRQFTRLLEQHEQLDTIAVSNDD